MPLETVDILGVELFATGTHNQDTYTEDDLDAMVTAAGAIPMSRPVKLGHNDDQQFAQADGLPAFGWVENLRRSGEKLMGDLKAVPSKLADLINAGAYRTRSAEVYWNFEAGGVTYPRVFKAISLLGADMPAVANLNDITALYTYSQEEGDLHVYEAAAEPAATYAIQLPLAEEGSYEWLKDQISDACEAVCPGCECYVANVWPNLAIVNCYCPPASGMTMSTMPMCMKPGDRDQTFVIPFAFDGQTVTLAPQSEWQAVEEQDLWVAAYAAAVEQADPDTLTKLSTLMGDMESLIKGQTGAPMLRMKMKDLHAAISALTRTTAAKKDSGTKDAPAVASKTTTNALKEGDPVMKERIYALLGLAADVSEDDALAQVGAMKAKAETPPEPHDYADLQAKAEAGVRAEKKLYEIQRTGVIDRALGATDGNQRIEPATMEKWVARYDKDPDGVSEILSELPVLRKLGSELGAGIGSDDIAVDQSNRQAVHDRAIAYQKAHPELAKQYAADEFYDVAVAAVTGEV